MNSLPFLPFALTDRGIVFFLLLSLRLFNNYPPGTASLSPITLDWPIALYQKVREEAAFSLKSSLFPLSIDHYLSVSRETRAKTLLKHNGPNPVTIHPGALHLSWPMSFGRQHSGLGYVSANSCHPAQGIRSYVIWCMQDAYSPCEIEQPEERLLH